MQQYRGASSRSEETSIGSQGGGDHLSGAGRLAATMQNVRGRRADGFVPRGRSAGKRRSRALQEIAPVQILHAFRVHLCHNALII